MWQGTQVVWQLMWRSDSIPGTGIVAPGVERDRLFRASQVVNSSGTKYVTNEYTVVWGPD